MRSIPYKKDSPRCTGHSQAVSVRSSLGGYLACSERLDPPEERRDVKDGDLQTEGIPFEVQQLGFFQELAALVPFIRNHFLWEPERKGRTTLKHTASCTLLSTLVMHALPLPERTPHLGLEAAEK